MLQLVRDPRGVVWSRLKARGRDREAQRPNRSVRWLVIRSTLDWILLNLMAAALLRSTPSGIRLRYEDIAVDPRATLEAVEALAGLESSTAAASIAAGRPVNYGHMIGGNPHRLAGDAPVVFDREWATAAPEWVRRLVWGIAGPLARHYGYQR